VERTVGTGYRRVAGERDVRLRRWIRGVACAAAGERIRLAAGVQQRQVAAGGDGQPSVTARPGQIDHRGYPPEEIERLNPVRPANPTTGLPREWLSVQQPQTAPIGAAMRIAYLYFTADKPELIRAIAPSRAAYRHEHATPGYLGGCRIRYVPPVPRRIFVESSWSRSRIIVPGLDAGGVRSEAR